jgi:hypothetical protein
VKQSGLNPERFAQREALCKTNLVDGEDEAVDELAIEQLDGECGQTCCTL